jgi:hypothetical protein
MEHRMRYKNEQGNPAGRKRGIETVKMSEDPRKALYKHKIRKRRRRMA